MALAACSAPDGAAKDDSGVEDTAPVDTDVDDTDVEDTDVEDTDVRDTDDTSDGPSGLDQVLSDLGADRDATLLAISGGAGWPAEVDGGYLFVTTEPGAWSLAGDFEGWSGLPMTQESGYSWVVAEVTAESGYKFTDGTDWNADPWSRQYAYDDFGEMSLVHAASAHLERLFEVESDAMRARTVRAWVPAEPATHVLYVHDGQNLFDPAAIWGGWHLQESAPPAMLIVGLDNTADRMEEYTHVIDVRGGEEQGGNGDAYAAYVQDTVRPLVADTWGEPATVGVMGSSLGGLISFHIADRYPGEYTFAASLSGTMGWGSIGTENDTMIDRYGAAGHRGTALYLDSGGSGTTCADSDGDGTNDDDPTAADNYCENVQLRDVLSTGGYTFETDLWHWHAPDAEHNEAAWAERVWRPLEIFAGL
ncbi:MAG: alpha/beta hydrolase-fold protein [Pseudomonadota bacterium]|nr:alpha/beta hydrolase-fold protein [Pseudomonadota bacterium]